MTDLCAIQGQLVDVRNVFTDKCVKLTIHVSAERAMEVMTAFGWPTNVSPVPVAVARLDANRKEQQSAEEPSVATPAPSADNAAARAPRETILARRAAILCNDPVFQAFLYEHDMIAEKTKELAATAVRLICHVESRSEIIPGTSAADAWHELYSKFMAWKIAA